jgi:hypothetical protein
MTLLSIIGCYRPDAPLALREPLPWRPSSDFIGLTQYWVKNRGQKRRERSQNEGLHGSGPRRASGASWREKANNGR